MAGADQSCYAFVGSFTTAERKARGDGIHLFKIGADGSFTHVRHAAKLDNPSFLIIDQARNILYAAHGDRDFASAFAIDPGTRELRELGRAATGGLNGVHLVLDPSRAFLVLANYTSGSVAVLPVSPNGSLSDAVQVLKFEGPSGPIRGEQDGARPHQVVLDPTGRFVLVPDKGLDRVFILRFDPAAGRLAPTEPGYVETRRGAGPRHLAFHPSLPIVWVLNELDSTITTYRWDDKQPSLTPLEIHTTLPTDFVGNSASAEIAVSSSGRVVMVTNRGHGGVAAFASDPSTGLLQPRQWLKTGRDPRFATMSPDGRFLLVANEQSDTIVTFGLDETGERLAETGIVVKTLSPVTIAFASE
jgi:6-phosphogluconolactonase